jgi:hypothetical protein
MFNDATARRGLAPRRVPGLPVGRWPKLALAGAAAAAAAAAAIAVPALLPGGAGTARAWAVDRNPDGTVTITVNAELKDPSGIQHALDAAGVPAVVAVQAFTTGTNFDCQWSTPNAAPKTAQIAVIRSIPPQRPSASHGRWYSWVVTPAAMPAGDTLYIAAVTSPNAAIVMAPEIATAGSPPTCVHVPAR